MPDFSLRAWCHDEHLRNVFDFHEWVPMRDEHGNVLAGIDGKHGVRGTKADGTHIGADFIRMQPGSRFPLHFHDGDHELYVISGRGFVHIDGVDVGVVAGDLIHIPAEHPHGVWVDEGAKLTLVFVAMGHPHRRVDARDRMWTVDEAGVPTGLHRYKKSFSSA